MNIDSLPHSSYPLSLPKDRDSTLTSLHHLIRWKIIDSAVNEVLEALSMHVAPPAVQIVVVAAGVTVLSGLHNPPYSWTGMVGPSLPGFTIALCVNSLL
jgi:hypothetical protein